MLKSSCEIPSHPARYDTDSFSLLHLPLWEFLLFPTEQKLLEVIHDACPQPMGGMSQQVFTVCEPEKQAWKYLILLGLCLLPRPLPSKSVQTYTVFPNISIPTHFWSSFSNNDLNLLQTQIRKHKRSTADATYLPLLW